jgi:hypothetical protein
MVDKANKALQEYPNIIPPDIFDDDDPLLVECVNLLMDTGFSFATACKGAVALKRKYDK